MTLLDRLNTIRTGMSAAVYRAALGDTALPPMQYDVAVADDPIPFQEFPDLGIAIVFNGDGSTVDSVEYGVGFKGEINGIAIGMTGDAVERLLGPCDRTWSRTQQRCFRPSTCAGRRLARSDFACLRHYPSRTNCEL